MIDGREILKYSRDMQRDRRTEKDNFCAGLSMHLARVRVLKLRCFVNLFYTVHALSPCEGIETRAVLFLVQKQTCT